MYCLRRAALRLAPSSTFVPARPRQITTLNVPRPFITTQSTRSAFQRRWNTDEAAKKPERNASAEKATESNKVDVAAADEENAQVTDTAVHASSAASTRPNEVPNIEQSKVEAREENQTEPRAGQEDINATNVTGQATARRINGRPTPEESVLADRETQASEDEIKERKRRRAELIRREPSARPTLFIANLFYDITAEDLQKEMEKYGTVEKCSIVHDNRGMSKGVAYVQFSTVEAATHARDTVHMSVLEGRRVIARYAHFNLVAKANASTATRTLYIGNLPFDMTDTEINHLFRDIPNVIDIRVSVDRRTGQIRGFCHAEFLDVKSARIGFEALSTVIIKDRALKLDYSPDQRTAVPIRRVFSNSK